MAKKEKFDKKNLVRYQPDNTPFQQKVDEAKLDFRSHNREGGPLENKVTMAKELRKIIRSKEELETQISELNVKIEALNQMLVDELEDEGITKFTLPEGLTTYQEQRVYVAIQDKEKFYEWIDANGLDDLYTVHSSTASALVKERLENGQELPPGAAAFLKASIRFRQPSSKGD